MWIDFRVTRKKRQVWKPGIEFIFESTAAIFNGTYDGPMKDDIVITGIELIREDLRKNLKRFEEEGPEGPSL